MFTTESDTYQMFQRESPTHIVAFYEHAQFFTMIVIEQHLHLYCTNII